MLGAARPWSWHYRASLRAGRIRGQEWAYLGGLWFLPANPTFGRLTTQSPSISDSLAPGEQGDVGGDCSLGTAGLTLPCPSVSHLHTWACVAYPKDVHSV